MKFSHLNWRRGFRRLALLTWGIWVIITAFFAAGFWDDELGMIRNSVFTVRLSPAGKLMKVAPTGATQPLRDYELLALRPIPCGSGSDDPRLPGTASIVRQADGTLIAIKSDGRRVPISPDVLDKATAGLCRLDDGRLGVTDVSSAKVGRLSFRSLNATELATVYSTTVVRDRWIRYAFFYVVFSLILPAVLYGLGKWLLGGFIEDPR